MFKTFEGARLGIFVFIGTVLLVFSILLVGNKDSLFVKTIQVKAYFHSVQGLKTGAPARLSGYDVGNVSQITLVPDGSGQVEVVINIQKELAQFIRIDSEASIETEGLVGKKIVVITAGSKDMAPIQEGGVIKSEDPISISEIVNETKDVMKYLNDITKEFSEIVAKINQGEGTIGRLVNDEALYESTVKITNTADKSLTQINRRFEEVSEIIVGLSGSYESIVVNIDSTIVDVKNLIGKVERGEGVLGALVSDRSSYDSIKTVINNLVNTTEQFEKGAKGFAENMEALKHNWLFKKYFEERGYWETSDYEKELDSKILEVKKQNEIIDQKIKELKELESNLNKPKE